MLTSSVKLIELHYLTCEKTEILKLGKWLGVLSLSQFDSNKIKVSWVTVFEV